MASLRRSKNYANDAQTPLFLYAILKQLDLRSIDWNSVADKLDISNGHAARMRYSRMKTQFEGVPAQSRTAKPKKEKPNNKPANKDTTKGKRQLLEEEEERINREKIIENEFMYPAEKRSKRNPESELATSFQPLRHNIHERFMDLNGRTPIIKFENPVNEFSNTSVDGHRSQPVVKREPNDFSAEPSNFSPLIKNESTGLVGHCTSNAITASDIKIEPDWPSSFDMSNSLLTNTRMGGLQIPGHDDKVMLRPFFPHSVNSAMQTIDPSCMITRSRPAPMEMSSFLHHRPIADYFPVDAPAPCPSTNFMFNPNATTFEDMLTMPLQEYDQSDIGIDTPVVGANIASMVTGVQSSSYMDEAIVLEDTPLDIPSSVVDNFQHFIESSPKSTLAAETDSKHGVKVDGEGQSDSTTKVTTENVDSATDQDDNHDGVFEAENVSIKQEIIEIYD